MVKRIAILGTGLLGASVGLALRKAGYKGSIVGWNRGAEGAETALAAGAVDEIYSDGIEAARSADLIVLSMPIYATLDWMQRLAPVLTAAQLVTDVGSTKLEIAKLAEELFNAPGKAAFLPGHPMAGKERGGADLGDALLFENAMWIFTDSIEARRSAEAEGHIRELRHWVEAIGAHTMELDPARHDELVAWVSHMPQFLSTALSALLLEEMGDAPELKHVGGRALREMTRLGASPYSMWRDIALTNTEGVSRALQALEQRIQHLRENLRTPELRDEFERANQFRRDLPTA